MRLAVADRAVSVAWLTPYLRARQHRALIVDIDQTELRLGEDRALDLRAVGVHVRDPDGRLLGASPAVGSVSARRPLLLEQRIAVRRIDAVAPSPTLIRRPDGSIGLHEQSDGGEANSFDIGAIVAEFLTTSEHQGLGATWSTSGFRAAS